MPFTQAGTITKELQKHWVDGKIVLVNPPAEEDQLNVKPPAVTIPLPVNPPSKSVTPIVANPATEEPKYSNSKIYIVAGSVAGSVTLSLVLAGFLYSKKKKSKQIVRESVLSVDSRDSIAFTSEELNKIEEEAGYDEFMDRRCPISAQ